MATSTTIVNNRRFVVKGQITCLFTPASTELAEEIPNLQVELWQKSPLNVFFLGKASTDADGNFNISFEVTDDTSYLAESSIENVFAKIYYRGNLISGANPYTDDEVSSFASAAYYRRPIKDITLNEGFNDIGVYEIEITKFEYPADTSVTEIASQPENLFKSILFDIREASSHHPVPIGYTCRFRGYIGEAPYEFTIFSTDQTIEKEGYAELLLPEVPIAIKEGAELVVNLQLEGAGESASQNCYIRLDDGSSGYYYTLITDLLIHDGSLCVKAADTYYTVSDLPNGLEDVTIIGVTATGIIAKYDENDEEWDFSNQFTFYQIEFPEHLDQVADGIYATNGSTGSIVSGQLGDGTFEVFSIKMKNRGIFPISIELKVEFSKAPVFEGIFTNVLAGSGNFIMVETDDFPEPNDLSPNLSDIETVSGITFSTAFVDFLEEKELTTLNTLKKAGPIRFINDFPTTGITEGEVELLQAHVDLYTLDINPQHGQLLIDEGYDSIYTIAQTPKEIFLNDVENTPEGITLFLATSIYEKAAQNLKLVSNILSGKIADYELQHQYIPDVADSSFAQTAFSKFINRCECEDCTSAVSPFSYLVDLLKYGAKHIKKTGSPSYTPVDYNAFLTLLEDYFFQPFGSFDIDCETLHKEYCRVRLVTEILEQYVATKTLPADVLTRLENDRKNFILLTYKTLLTQMGTSYEELRHVIALQDPDGKKTAALRLSERLGIPLYVPGSTTLLTVERMWLTFGSTEPEQELDAENLEIIFGFRDTQRDVLTNTPMALIRQWKGPYLFEQWKNVDFPLSAYSREDVNPSDDNTFKPEWKPIIDPDSFGRSDMTYESSAFALELWRHRKADTDSFLSYFVSNPAVLSHTSADLLARKLRVPGKDLSGVRFQDDKVYIKDPSNSEFVAFKVLTPLETNGANTDIELLQSSSDPIDIQPEMFQPEGDEPVMQYDSVTEVLQPLLKDETTITLNWGDTPVIVDYVANGRIQLISKDSNTEDIYIYDPSASTPPALEITSVTIVSESEVTLVVTPALSQEFVSRNISFAYRAEVDLYTTTLPDPEKVCNAFFNISFPYYLLSPAPVGAINPVNYTTFQNTISWPPPLDEEDTFYKKLKKLYELIRSGTTDPFLLDVISYNLQMDAYSFNLMMELLIASEHYLESMYSYDQPDTEKRYQVASIGRNSARHLLNEFWVKEEIKHIPTGGTDPERLMLRSQFFWKAINEPQAGPWDSSLQTIPALVGDISTTNIPIIDPELVPVQRLLVSPDAETYRDMYADRQRQLAEKFDTFFSWLVPFDIEGFDHILNYINTGDKDDDYNLGPDYGTDMKQLIKDFESTDPFLQLKANNALQQAFALTSEAFSAIIPVRNAYQSGNPTQRPSTIELRTVTALLVTACKKKRFYFTHGLETGWIEQEIEQHVKYYNVLTMQLDPVRGSILNRSEWQQTLAKWNRVPTVLPDIVPPENIKRFVQGETAHDLWISRKNTLDLAYTQIVSMFNETKDAGTLFQNLKLLLSLVVMRSSGTLPAYDYYEYFTALFAKEDAGEDIRPELNQLNFYITEYRLLRQVYEVLEKETETAPSQPSHLLPSEYEAVINITVRVNIANVAYFGFVEQEYYDNIVLNGNDFENYAPAIINFPLDMVQETVQWRAPQADKKAWKDTLNTRIDRKQSVLDEWQTVLEESEDITMPTMRDALIQALRNNCESLNEAAERLARTLFIETKDNCCVKHSRVSHAIETLQGIIFALESGVYDNYLNGFTLTAPNFDREWAWLGSYATWRSAVFTYIYPENLLYPTLKKRQSPAFIELAETIQNASRFTPINACQAAKRYQQYFEDVQNLKIVCTANADAYIFRKDPLDCCGDLNNSMKEYMTYYIAQSTLSGKGYMSEKPFYETNSDAHDFWKEIPLRANAKIIGCLPLNRDFDENGQSTGTALWLFYTFSEDGNFKLAYIKKDLMTAGSSWTDEEEVDLGDLADAHYFRLRRGEENPDKINIIQPGDILSRVTICQHSEAWDWVFFIFSYKRANGGMRHLQVRYMAQEDYLNVAPWSLLFFDHATMPVTSIRHEIYGNAVNLQPLIGVTLVFKDQIQTGYYGSLDGNTPVLPKVDNDYQNMIGGFKRADYSDRFVLAARGNTGETRYGEGYFTYTKSGNTITLVSHYTLPGALNAFEKNVLSIAPSYNQSRWEGATAVTVYTDNTLAGLRYRLVDMDGLKVTGDLIFSLAPEKRVPVAIESGECIENFDLRTANIKEHLRANMNAPMGNPIGSFYCTSTIKEVLYEAYYFVPMLLALDQQQRGDYPTALNWYRSVYDYTSNLSTKRKVFYGLVLEESVTNVYNRPSDWLLDPLNPHLIAQTRTNAYTKYTLMNIIQCMLAYGDREFTIDTIETVPNARKLYSSALDLLKVNELRTKPSQCYTKSHYCFQTAITATIDAEWDNSFSQLQNQLQLLGSVDLIEQTAGELADILNDDEASMMQRFTSAFTYLDGIEPAPPKEESVSGLIEGEGERMNDAFRYLLAGTNTRTFNIAVERKLALTLAQLTSQTPDEVIYWEGNTKIDWLKEPVADNTTPLTFRFIDEEGVQQLDRKVAFNPLNPSVTALQSNLVFSNAPVLYTSFFYQQDFTPFIDYAFCLPSNPVYSSLELKANLELFKIQNCRNIAGMERSLDIYAAATDSTTGVPVIGAGGNLVLPASGAIMPSQYRFRVLIERAKQLVAQAQQLESQFLAAMEKEDAENYNQLRARQDLQTAKATVKLQDMRVKQSEMETEVANLQLQKANFVKTTYSNWIDAGLIGYETASISFLIASAAFQTSASVAALTPAGRFNVEGSLIAIAQSLSATSSIMSQLASFERRRQEWLFQSDLANFDISIASQQVQIAQQNTRIVSQEREIASMNMDNAADTLEFLKTKFTNAELYRWMGNVLERAYSYMLSLASSVAKTAERQFYFEQQQQGGPFILDDYWEMPQTGSLTGGGTDRRGLTGSTRLLQDITRLDQYAFDNTKRKLQMTKVISLGQLYPDAFQTFRETGVLNFDLTDRLFDYDFPGHYLRLVNGVKVSVVGLIPVYDNIKATLTAATTSYTVINANNTFQKVPIRRLEAEQIALTGASRATGLFEFQAAQGELLNPFEGMGIESRWEFKMPMFSNRIDYSNIADVLIEVDYTALDSYQYRFQVLQDIDNTLGFSRGFSFTQDYPDQWYELQRAQPSSQPFYVEIELKQQQFPQGVRDIRLDGSNLLLHFVRKDGFTDEITVADFSLVTTAANAQPMGGETLNGTFTARPLSNILNSQSPATPFVKLRLAFANTAPNREMFANEDVMDIVLLVSCKAELPTYPL